MLLYFFKKRLKNIQTDFSCSVKFYDGDEISYGDKDKNTFTLNINNVRALRKSVLKGDLGFLEAYLDGDVDINGSIVDFVAFGRQVSGIEKKQVATVTLFQKLYDHYHEWRYGNHSLVQAVKNAKFHYNLGSENLFFHYLDAKSPYNVAPTYTCAYWKEGTKDLNEAQFNKLDHVCRKVQLQPGDSLVDVGGGWGSLLFHAVERYGIAHGLNISPTPDQNRWMQSKLEELGLQDRLSIREADFRQIDGLEGTFDKYISTGVYEHAGRPQLEAWIKAMSELLKPGGKGVLHFIGKQDESITHAFIRKHVFPGGYLPSLGETVDLMKQYGLEMLDVENLRRHYALTLAEWAKNFYESWPQIQATNPAVFDERFRRTWHLYLWLCVGAFERQDAGIGLYQITFSKGWTEDYPMSRQFLYDDVPEPTPSKFKART